MQGPTNSPLRIVEEEELPLFQQEDATSYAVKLHAVKRRNGGVSNPQTFILFLAYHYYTTPHHSTDALFSRVLMKLPLAT